MSCGMICGSMPDLREIMLLDKMGSRLFGLPALFRMSSESRLRLRRAVVISAGFPPLNWIYEWIYKAHIWYAVRVLKHLPNTLAIYIARGVALGEIVSGVSDVDLVVLGDWTEEQHGLAMTALRRLSNLSPLYDAMLWQHAHSLANFRNLYETDLYWQCRFDQGRRHIGSRSTATISWPHFPALPRNVWPVAITWTSETGGTIAAQHWLDRAWLRAIAFFGKQHRLQSRRRAVERIGDAQRRCPRRPLAGRPFEGPC